MICVQFIIPNKAIIKFTSSIERYKIEYLNGLKPANKPRIFVKFHKFQLNHYSKPGELESNNWQELASLESLPILDARNILILN